MTPWRSIWLVAQREIIVRGRSRSYLLSTGFIVVVIAAAVFGIPALENFFDEEPSYDVGIVSNDPEGVADAIEATADRLDVVAQITNFGEPAAAREALDDGDLDALLLNQQTIEFDTDTTDEVILILNEAVRQWRLPAQLEEAGLTLEDVEPILQPEPLQVNVLDEDDDSDAAGLAIAGIATILLFISIMTYGQWVLQGVIEEKASRIVEVLLSTLRPYQLLAGKIIGILVLGVAQLVVVLAAGLLALLVVGEIDIPRVAALGVIAAALWFVLGLLLYGVVFGVAGALVSRQEEASNVTLPITSVLMGGYFAAIFIIQDDPGSTAAVAVSLFPFTAPVSMPSRVALGEVAVWEFALAVVLMLGTIAASIAAGGRIYAGAILRIGPRIALRDAWRLRG